MYAILFLAALCAGGCSSGDSIEPDTAPIAQTVLFGQEWINWAWGYQHHAEYIDSDGRILAVSYSMDDSIWALGDNGRYTEDDIRRLLEKATETGNRIGSRHLSTMYCLIEPAGGGALSKPRQVGAESRFKNLQESHSRCERRLELQQYIACGPASAGHARTVPHRRRGDVGKHNTQAKCQGRGDPDIHKKTDRHARLSCPA
jgi:hypothetical protein